MNVRVIDGNVLWLVRFSCAYDHLNSFSSPELHVVFTPVLDMVYGLLGTFPCVVGVLVKRH